MGLFMLYAQDLALTACRRYVTTGLETLEEPYKLELANNSTFCLDHTSTHVFSLILETCKVSWQIAQLNRRVVSSS